MQQNYHRYLDLPFSIKKPPIDFTVKPEWDNIDLQHKYKDKEMESWLSDLGLTCSKVEVFYTPPHGSVPIHADDYDMKKNKADDHVKINISFGPEEASLRWWKSSKTFLVKDASMDCTSRLTLASLEEDSEMVYEVNTNFPSLVNVGELHSTHNPTDEGRWTLCFVPCMRGRMITMSRALIIFDQFIIK